MRILTSLVSVLGLVIADNTARAAAKVDFNRDIRPIMSDTCFHCHGFDAKARKGGFRIDLRAEALKPAKSGEIPIVPGKPDQSEIIKRIFTTDEDDIMPPKSAHKDLTPA
ncbi:MAG TPA: c-type cytochrome domain-containing protein, partial [Verrucomicrobiae bacterium]